MTRLTSFLIFCVLGIFISVAHSAPRKPIKSLKSLSRTVQQVRISCKVHGTPAEFPNDLQIKNIGKAEIKKGTKLSWSTKGQKGVYTLKKALLPSKHQLLSNVMKNGLPAGSNCAVRVKSDTRRVVTAANRVRANRAATTARSNRRPEKKMGISCTVNGTPSEFPNDIQIKNLGNVVIKKGVNISWSTKGERGVVRVKENLSPKKTAFFSNVLKNGLSAGTRCSAKLTKVSRKATGSKASRKGARKLRFNK
jgi:hypothetical protein